MFYLGGAIMEIYEELGMIQVEPDAPDETMGVKTVILIIMED